MLLALFNRPHYAQRRYFVQEITGLDDVFDGLDEWPHEKRNIACETVVRYCREAANGQWPIDAVREIFRVFLKRNAKFAENEDVPPNLRFGDTPSLAGCKLPASLAGVGTIASILIIILYSTPTAVNLLSSEKRW